MNKLWSNILLFVISYLLLAVLFWIGLFGGTQERLTDLLFLPRSANKNIVIIAIDDKSINKIGRWPWDRKVHAELLEKLSSQKPKAVGYDVAFPEASNPESDQILSSAFSKHNIILPVEQVDMGLQKPYELFQTKIGLVNVLIDHDGIVRKIPVDSFASEIIKKKAEISDDYLRINYSGKPGSFTTHSFIDVLENRIPLENFANKYVLVGVTAVDLHDSQVTPVSAGREMAGVEIHANAMATILENKYLVSESKLFTLFTLFAFTLLAVATAHWPIAWLWLVIYIIYSFVSFDLGIIRNLIYTPLAIILVNIASLIMRFLSERSQKEYIRKAFSYYLSDSVLKEILKDPSKLKLGGERKEITVLFTDIAGFTSISEKMDPVDLAKLLNDYLTRMTNIVFANKGVLDKYIGDAVMAFWGAPLDQPLHAFNACNSAIQMMRKLNEMKPLFKTKYDIEVNIGIGINSGPVSVGNMGSERIFEYTVIGDHVNLASRLEGLTKHYGVPIITTRFTCDAIQKSEKPLPPHRTLDHVKVKGKKNVVELIQVLEQDYCQPGLDSFEKGRQLYTAQKWDSASEKFKEASELFRSVNHLEDETCQVYLYRCATFKETPPNADWDGSWEMVSK